MLVIIAVIEFRIFCYHVNLKGYTSDGGAIGRDSSAEQV
jgi:hypothetical protein